jgi:hypothetical protein
MAASKVTKNMKRRAKKKADKLAHTEVSCHYFQNTYINTDTYLPLVGVIKSERGTPNRVERARTRTP